MSKQTHISPSTCGDILPLSATFYSSVLQLANVTTLVVILFEGPGEVSESDFAPGLKNGLLLCSSLFSFPFLPVVCMMQITLCFVKRAGLGMWPCEHSPSPVVIKCS